MAVTVIVLSASVLLGCGDSGVRPASKGKNQVTIGVPGIPPVFVNLMVYVASNKGYFRSRGLDVRIRPLSTGTDVSRAVQSGEIDSGIIGTPGAVALRAKGGSVVGILGAPNADYVVATDDESVSGCASLKSKTIGVDATAAPKALALQAMLASCHLTAKDVKMINLGGPQDADALIAGQVKTAVLHIDELAAVQQHKRSVRTVLTSQLADPLAHYAMLVTSRRELKDAGDRARLVQVVAALHQAIIYINDSANLSDVASIAAQMTKEPVDVTTAAITAFVKMRFWPADDGLPRNRIEHVTKQQVAAGNINASNAPAYDQLVDISVFHDAVK